MGARHSHKKSAARLRQLDRAAFVICGSIWSRPDLRLAHSQSHKVNPWRTVHSQTAPFETLSSLNVTHSCWGTFIASAMAIPRSIASRCATACLEGALKGHQSWDILWRHWLRILLAEVPKGPDRNSKVKKRRPQLWEAGKVHDLIGRILGQQHTGPQEKKTLRPQTAEQRGKRACALTARGINQRSHEGTRGWSSSGLGRTQNALDYSFDFRSSGRGAHPTGTERTPAARATLFGGRHKGSPQCFERARAQQDRHRVAPPCQIGTHEYPRTLERHEHLDAIIAFAGGRPKHPVQSGTERDGGARANFTVVKK